MGTLKRINVALRALMELGIVVGIGYWGFVTGETTIMKILLGILLPVLVFAFWGFVDFHQAGRLGEPLRLIQELVISGLAALALYLAGQPLLGLALALLSILHHALIYLLGGRLLKQ